jgi:hypothetical protein
LAQSAVGLRPEVKIGEAKINEADGNPGRITPDRRETAASFKQRSYRSARLMWWTGLLEV